MNGTDAIEAIRSGKMRMHEIGSHFPAEESIEIRRKSLGDLPNIGHYSLDAERAMKRNVENMIGVAQIPMGIAPGLLLNGKSYNVPLATTEGALVASVSRGCRAISESGGANAYIVRERMTRAPVFSAESAKDALGLTQWVESNFASIKAVCEEGSRHLKLMAIRPWIVGRNVFLRFECETGDAMGMNMVTIGVARAADFIEKGFKKARHVSVTGNMCVDKKPSALNFIEGRGKSVIAEVVLNDGAITGVLKTTPEQMADVCYRKCLVGSAQAASYGFNLHIANMAAALYIATGQDPAHVVSASMGFTLAEPVEKGLHVSVTMPCVEVGTVGGGTSLGTQSEALKILGCGSARELAQVVAGTALAGEISLMAASAAHHLAKAHQEHGRG